MFEVPAAKRVKRSELRADSDVEEGVDSFTLGLNEPGSALAYTLEYEILIHEPVVATINTANAEEETFHFNLFSSIAKPSTNKEEATASPGQQKTQLVTIRSPSPAAEVATSQLYFRTSRPNDYYLTSALSKETKARLHTEYVASAVSSDSIVAKSTSPWPGAALRWKVLDLPSRAKQIVVHRIGVSDHKSQTAISQQDEQISKPRARPSKKRRLLLKTKALRRQRIIDETKTKEEHEREKKNKKNRERKLKRRAKERREKSSRNDNGLAEAASEDLSNSD